LLLCQSRSTSASIQASAVATLTGSTRLYEDPDVDEYDNMDDLGYTRRAICDQQDFILHHLDAGEGADCEPYFHHTPEQQDTHSTTPRSSSDSSSASLSSPGTMSGMSSCQQQLAGNTSLALGQQQQQLLQHSCSAEQQQPLHVQNSDCMRTSDSAPTGDEAWDSGPAGITFAEPVSTPTKSPHPAGTNDQQPSLSRVESLSNSFIDELDSGDGQADCGRLSEVGSTAGDISTPPRSCRATAADDAGVGAAAATTAAISHAGAGADLPIAAIDLSPPSPPPDCAADAGFDLSNIFEIGLRAGSSRTSSVDVLQGSMRCWSETDSEMGADTSGKPPWPALTGTGTAAATKSVQAQQQQQQQQQQRPGSASGLPVPGKHRLPTGSTDMFGMWQHQTSRLQPDHQQQTEEQSQEQVQQQDEPWQQQQQQQQEQVPLQQQLPCLAEQDGKQWARSAVTPAGNPEHLAEHIQKR
jgi:hypothetical protein